MIIISDTCSDFCPFCPLSQQSKVCCMLVEGEFPICEGTQERNWGFERETQHGCWGI